MITIFAPAGIGEVGPTATTWPARSSAAVAADPAGPLVDGDIVVVTSKIVQQGRGPRRRRPASGSSDHRGGGHGRPWPARADCGSSGPGRAGRRPLPGVDNSNVAPGRMSCCCRIDPDAQRRRAAAAAAERCRRPVGVIISDTAGRAWRIGQTDHAIGAAGVVVGRRYAGLTDDYGNPLQVTVMALADELAAAADLVKGKLGRRPVAVVRGLADLVTDERRSRARPGPPRRQDMFAPRQPGGGAGGRAEPPAARSDRYEELRGPSSRLESCCRRADLGAPAPAAEARRLRRSGLAGRDATTRPAGFVRQAAAGRIPCRANRVRASGPLDFATSAHR